MHIRAYLPVKLATLSKVDPEEAVLLLQDWAYGNKTLRVLWSEVNEKLDKYNMNIS